MSDSLIKRFFSNFGKVPEPKEAPPLIPQAWRVPFFLALSTVSLVALMLLLWLVVIPAINAETPVVSPAPAMTPAK